MRVVLATIAALISLASSWAQDASGGIWLCTITEGVQTLQGKKLPDVEGYEVGNVVLLAMDSRVYDTKVMITLHPGGDFSRWQCARGGVWVCDGIDKYSDDQMFNFDRERLTLLHKISSDNQIVRYACKAWELPKKVGAP